MWEFIIIAMVAVLAVVGCKLRKNADDGFLSKKQGNCLKGLAALLLIIVHIRERLTPMPLAYRLLATAGFLFVSIFFFYSGYGIIKNSISSETYVKKRLPRRILYLIFLIVVSEITYYLFDVLVFGRSFDFLDAIMCIFGITMINGAMWTIVSMLIIETVLLISVLIFSKFSKSTPPYVIFSIVGVFLYILISVLRNRGAWEMQSCFAFVMGAFIASKEQWFVSTISNKRNAILLLIIGAFSFLLFFAAPYLFERLFGADYLFVRVVFGSLASSTFILLLLLLLSKLSLGNPVSIFLGTIFTEIYLSHSLVLDLAKYIAPSFFETENSLILSFLLILIVLAVAIIIKLYKNLFYFSLSKIKEKHLKSDT